MHFCKNKATNCSFYFRYIFVDLQISPLSTSLNCLTVSQFGHHVSSKVSCNRDRQGHAAKWTKWFQKVVQFLFLLFTLLISKFHMVTLNSPRRLDTQNFIWVMCFSRKLVKPRPLATHPKIVKPQSIIKIGWTFVWVSDTHLRSLISATFLRHFPPHPAVHNSLLHTATTGVHNTLNPLVYYLRNLFGGASILRWPPPRRRVSATVVSSSRNVGGLPNQTGAARRRLTVSFSRRNAARGLLGLSVRKNTFSKLERRDNVCSCLPGQSARGYVWRSAESSWDLRESLDRDRRGLVWFCARVGNSLCGGTREFGVFVRNTWRQQVHFGHWFLAELAQQQQVCKWVVVQGFCVRKVALCQTYHSTRKYLVRRGKRKFCAQ